MKDDTFKIIVDKDVPKADVLVAGFPGNGLIGGIASEQLINTLGLEQVASMTSDLFPPTAVIFEGVPRRPVRIFSGDGFLLAKSDMVIPPELSSSLAETLVGWAVENDIEEVIIMDGIPSNDDHEEGKIWGVLSSHEAEKDAETLHLDIIERGAISGVSSEILLSAHENHLKAVGMLAEGNPDIPDPRSAARLLEKFGRFKDIEVETDSLIESAEQLEKQYSKLVSQTQKAQKDIEHRTAHPPLYG